MWLMTRLIFTSSNWKPPIRWPLSIGALFIIPIKYLTVWTQTPCGVNTNTPLIPTRIWLTSLPWCVWKRFPREPNKSSLYRKHLINVQMMSFWQGVKWQILCWILNVCFDFFPLTLKSDLKEFQFNQNHIFWVKAPL